MKISTETSRWILLKNVQNKHQAFLSVSCASKFNTTKNNPIDSKDAWWSWVNWSQSNLFKGVPTFRIFAKSTTKTSEKIPALGSKVQIVPQDNAWSFQSILIRFCGMQLKLWSYVLGLTNVYKCHAWNSKPPVLNGCFYWIPNLYVKNGWFTKHPFQNWFAWASRYYFNSQNSSCSPARPLMASGFFAKFCKDLA